jgi:hypothetical protein
MCKRKTKYVLLCFVFLFIQANAQIYQRVILDLISKKPLDFVYITTNVKSINYISNESGQIRFQKINEVSTYIFYKLGYKNKRLTQKELLSKDTIYLERYNIELPAIEILSKKFDTVVRNKRFYIDDYLILDNGDHILITSKINIKGFEVIYYKKSRGITYTRKFIKETDPGFFKDCFMNYHLLTAESSRQIYLTSDSTFDFLPKYQRSQFDSSIANAMLVVDSSVIYRTPNKTQFIQSKNFVLRINSIAVNFYKLSKNKIIPFYHVQYNQALMNMIRNELKDWEMLYANKTVNQSYIKNQLMFFEKVIAKPISAPIFKRNDTIVVFNMQDNYIQLLNTSGDSLVAIPLNLDKLNKLKSIRILFDEFTRQFFVHQVVNDSPYIFKLSLLTGQLTKEIKLEKPFPKNIKLFGGKIYYIVKEKQWDDTSYLYSQYL